MVSLLERIKAILETRTVGTAEIREIDIDKALSKRDPFFGIFGEPHKQTIVYNDRGEVYGVSTAVVRSLVGEPHINTSVWYLGKGRWAFDGIKGAAGNNDYFIEELSRNVSWKEEMFDHHEHVVQDLCRGYKPKIDLTPKKLTPEEEESKKQLPILCFNLRHS